MKHRKKLLLIVSIILTITLIIIILKINYKNIKIGNNINSLDINESYILNINSYKAIAEVVVSSNKNINKYLIKQEVEKDKSVQEVLEPESMNGVTMLYENETLTLKNSKLNLSKMYKNFPYIMDNYMFLTDFIYKYKENKDDLKKTIENSENSVIFKVKENNKNEEMLYINKTSGKPEKIIIQDNNKKEVVYILYKEIDI